jgi:HEAT repeat protein
MEYSPDDLLQRLNNSDPDERRVALALIGRMRYHALLEHVVTAMITDFDADVRAMAAWTLDLMSSADTIPALIDAMHDASFGVRSNAGWALVHLAQRLTPAMVVPDVIDVLEEDDYPEARRMAYLVLQRIDDADARRAVEDYRE